MSEVKLGGYIYKWGEKIGLSDHFITKDKASDRKSLKLRKEQRRNLVSSEFRETILILARSLESAVRSVWSLVLLRDKLITNGRRSMMSSKAQTSGFVIAAKADESEPDILVDELHPCVCPNCGISKFEEGHEKDIITNEETKRRDARCWGGFGVARYRILPHKCKACDTVFAPWKVEKKANISVIGGCVGLIFSLAFAIITFVIAIMDELLFALITFIMLCFSAGCIAAIHKETAREADDIEKEIADLLKYEDIIGEYLDPDEEEKTEDLDATFGVSMQQAVSACKELATQNVSEPKSAMEVFDTLTPEQKAVAYYLIGGGTLAAREEEILAMQHIQDQVQANTAKRMNDIWRLHI